MHCYCINSNYFEFSIDSNEFDYLTLVNKFQICSHFSSYLQLRNYNACIDERKIYLYICICTAFILPAINNKCSFSKLRSSIYSKRFFELSTFFNEIAKTTTVHNKGLGSTSN